MWNLRMALADLPPIYRVLRLHGHGRFRAAVLALRIVF